MTALVLAALANPAENYPLGEAVAGFLVLCGAAPVLLALWPRPGELTEEQLILEDW